MMSVYSWQVNALWLYLRIVSRAQVHRFTAKGRRLFERVVEAHADDAESEALKRILEIRSRFDNSTQQIDLEDHGSGSDKLPKRRTVRSIHRSSAIPHWWGVFLFRFVRELKPARVLELGANLGVSAAYIQSAMILNGNARQFVTIEGDPTLASIARETLAVVGGEESAVELGRFQDVLPRVLQRTNPLDLVFIDGHHEYQPTLEYFNQVRPFLSDKGAVVFDDVYFWSRHVRRAWKEIVRNHPESQSVDLAKFGILLKK